MSNKRFSVALTEAGEEQIAPFATILMHRGNGVAYINCKKVHTGTNYVHMIVEDPAGGADFDFSIPHHFVRAVLVIADEHQRTRFGFSPNAKP